MRTWHALLLLSALLSAGCVVKEPADEDGDGGTGTDDGTPQVHEIAMHSAKYVPDRITIAKGDTLRFAAHDTTHSVQSTNGVYDAGDVPAGTEKDVLANLAGSYTIQCRFHGDMRMALTVTA